MIMMKFRGSSQRIGRRSVLFGFDADADDDDDDDDGEETGAWTVGRVWPGPPLPSLPDPEPDKRGPRFPLEVLEQRGSADRPTGAREKTADGQDVSTKVPNTHIHTT